MKRLTMEEHLAVAPAAVRRAMLEDRANLEPGAAAVVGRLFRALRGRREPEQAPSAASFRAAAASEPTFRILLRALVRYAPAVSTASAVEVKREWVARRPPSPKRKPGRRSTARKAQPIDVATWPATWRSCYPALERAAIKASSLVRYKASINRCAQLVEAGEEFGFLTAYNLAQAFAAQRRSGETHGRAIAPITIANYLHALIMLGQHGGADPDGLAAMRYMREHLRGEAALGDKLKFARIQEIMEQGGFLHVADRIAAMRTAAAALPDHAAEKTLLLRKAALCAVHMNKPARTGDVSRWRIDEELERRTDGTWSLEWRQEKNDRDACAGELWPEVGEILDELILGGRPARFIHLRYGELAGKNWLTLSDHAIAAKWPSVMVKAAIGIPSHDLRTLAADYLRRHDPETAADVIATHLGHATRQAGDEYRALSDGEAATRSWQRIRGNFPTDERAAWHRSGFLGEARPVPAGPPVSEG